MGLPILSPYVNEDPRQVRHRARDPQPPSRAGGAPGHLGRRGGNCLGTPVDVLAERQGAVDLAKMPHLLVAGTTGAGKSVALNAMILSMLYKAMLRDVRLIMIDPKMLELSVYDGIPSLRAPLATDMKGAANALRGCVAEMERRYKLMAALGVRNLAGYNRKIREAETAGEPLRDPFGSPRPVAEAGWAGEVRSPVSTLPSSWSSWPSSPTMTTVGKKVEELIARLAQKARAAGMVLLESRGVDVARTCPIRSSARSDLPQEPRRAQRPARGARVRRLRPDPPGVRGPETHGSPRQPELDHAHRAQERGAQPEPGPVLVHLRPTGGRGRARRRARSLSLRCLNRPRGCERRRSSSATRRSDRGPARCRSRRPVPH